MQYCAFSHLPLYAGLCWLTRSQSGKVLGWVAYNLNKRNARGNSLKYDKKASTTNQSSTMRCGGTWQDLAVGRLRRLQLDRPKRQGHLVTGVVRGNSRQESRKSLCWQKRRESHPIKSNHRGLTRNGKGPWGWKSSRTESTLVRLWTWACKHGQAGIPTLLRSDWWKILELAGWPESNVKARMGGTETKTQKKHQCNLFGFRLSVTKRNVAGYGHWNMWAS